MTKYSHNEANVPGVSDVNGLGSWGTSDGLVIITDTLYGQPCSVVTSNLTMNDIGNNVTLVSTLARIPEAAQAIVLDPNTGLVRVFIDCDYFADMMPGDDPVTLVFDYSISGSGDTADGVFYVVVAIPPWVWVDEDGLPIEDFDGAWIEADLMFTYTVWIDEDGEAIEDEDANLVEIGMTL